MQNIPIFAADGTKTPPPALTVTSGYFPLQLLPAEQLNYFLNGATQSIQEWVNLITLAGLTPGPSQQGWTAISGLMASGFTFLGRVNVADAAVDTSPVSFGQAKKEPDYLYNLGLKASVAANALTISLTQADGTTNPSTGASQVAIAFRSATVTSDAVTIRTVTGALSLVIPSGATFGHASGVSDFINVYAIDNNGTVELAASTEALWDETRLWDTTVLDTASDSRTVLYSTTARSGVAIRFLGRFQISEATAGTWASAPTAVRGPNCPQSGVIFSTVSSGSAVSLTSPNTANITSITIPPGEWDITASFGLVPDTTTSISSITFGVSQTSATFPGGNPGMPPVATGEFFLRAAVVSPTVYGDTNARAYASGPYRIRVDVSTTLYLLARATFTASTLTAYGWIQARRVSK